MSTAICPNCKSPRSGQFCTVCGQNNRDYRRSLPPMLSELLLEAFEVDGRIVRSLKLLFFFPGALSKAFSENRRAHFISPVRLYIFTSLVFFFVFAQTAGFNAREELDKEVQALNSEHVNTTNVERFKAMLGRAQQAQVDLVMGHDGSLARAFLVALIDNVSKEEEKTSLSRGEHFIISQLLSILVEPARAFDKLIDNAPIAFFLLLPVYAAFLKVLYLRSGRYYVEHLVYALHLHSFAFLIFTALILLPDGPGWSGWLETLLYVALTVYSFVALRVYYQQSRRKTLLKYCILGVAYTLLLIPSAVFALAATFTLL